MLSERPMLDMGGDFTRFPIGGRATDMFCAGITWLL